MAAESSGRSYQSRWRAAGSVAILVAALMAAGAAVTNILRDTAVHTVRIFSGELPEGVTAETPVLACAAYWAVFLVALITALYMAFLDIRYIRLQYALEQRSLFEASLGKELTSAIADKRRKP